MKSLYQKFIILLITKPYLHLAISLGVIFILRIAFIKIVYAEDFVPTLEDQTPALLLEELLKQRDPIFETEEEQVKVVSEYKKYVDTRYSDGNSWSEQTFLTESQLQEQLYQTFKINTPNFYAQENIPDVIMQPGALYDKIIIDMSNILEKAKSKQDFIQLSIDYVKSNIDPIILAKTAEEVQDPDSAFYAYIFSFGSHKSLTIPPEEYLVNTIYQAFAIVYNNLNFLHVFDNPTILEKDTTLIENNFHEVYTKLTAANPDISIFLFQSLAQKDLLYDAVSFVRPNPLTQIFYDDILIEFVTMINSCTSKEDFILKAVAYAGNTLPANLWAVTESDLKNENSFVIQFVNQLSKVVDVENSTEETALAYNLYIATILSYNSANMANVLANPEALNLIYTNTLNQILGEQMSTIILNSFTREAKK